jgi:hypothetical protein
LRIHRTVERVTLFWLLPFAPLSAFIIGHKLCWPRGCLFFSFSFLNSLLQGKTGFLKLFHFQNDSVSGLGHCTRKHSFSETGYVSVFKRGEGDAYSVGSLRINHWIDRG